MCDSQETLPSSRSLNNLLSLSPNQGNERRPQAVNRFPNAAALISDETIVSQSGKLAKLPTDFKSGPHGHTRGCAASVLSGFSNNYEDNVIPCEQAFSDLFIKNAAQFNPLNRDGNETVQVANQSAVSQRKSIQDALQRKQNGETDARQPTAFAICFTDNLVDLTADLIELRRITSGKNETAQAGSNQQDLLQSIITVSRKSKCFAKFI